RTCHDLSYGLARSQNAIVARLAVEHLDPASLWTMARTFGFGSAPDAQFPASPSLVNVPEEPLAFARVAAGFWQATLSPLRGAHARRHDGEHDRVGLGAQRVSRRARAALQARARLARGGQDRLAVRGQAVRRVFVVRGVRAGGQAGDRVRSAPGARS